jgi:hypothetical protein
MLNYPIDIPIRETLGGFVSLEFRQWLIFCTICGVQDYCPFC